MSSLDSENASSTQRHALVGTDHSLGGRTAPFSGHFTHDVAVEVAPPSLLRDAVRRLLESRPDHVTPAWQSADDAATAQQTPLATVMAQRRPNVRIYLSQPRRASSSLSGDDQDEEANASSGVCVSSDGVCDDLDHVTFRPATVSVARRKQSVSPAKRRAANKLPTTGWKRPVKHGQVDMLDKQGTDDASESARVKLSSGSRSLKCQQRSQSQETDNKANVQIRVEEYTSDVPKKDTTALKAGQKETLTSNMQKTWKNKRPTAGQLREKSETNSKVILSESCEAITNNQQANDKNQSVSCQEDQHSSITPTEKHVPSSKKKNYRRLWTSQYLSLPGLESRGVLRPLSPSLDDVPFEDSLEFSCWTVYRRLNANGVRVSYDVIKRGMLTPAEYRSCARPSLQS